MRASSYVSECSIAIIPVQGILPVLSPRGPHSTGILSTGNRGSRRERAVFESKAHVVRNEQVKVSVTVIVQETAACTVPRLVTPKPCLLVTSVNVPLPLLR